jgi:hypothetical protein
MTQAATTEGDQKTDTQLFSTTLVQSVFVYLLFPTFFLFTFLSALCKK